MDEAELKDFGERLEWALKLRAMNKSQLAALIGVTPSAISQWISGDSKGYDAVNAIKAADVLGLNVKWLVLGKGPRFAISQDAETVAGAIEALPKEARQESFDFVLYKIERNGQPGGWREDGRLPQDALQHHCRHEEARLLT